MRCAKSMIACFGRGDSGMRGRPFLKKIGRRAERRENKAEALREMAVAAGIATWREIKEAREEDADREMDKHLQRMEELAEPGYYYCETCDDYHEIGWEDRLFVPVWDLVG